MTSYRCLTLMGFMWLFVFPTAVFSQTERPLTREQEAELQGQVWICVLDLETSQSRRLFAVPDIASAGSPAVSSNETKIAFDATMPRNNTTSQAQLFVATMDGSDIQNLGGAALPSWSPDGDRLLISQYGSKDRGVWSLNSDYTDAKLVDRAGWSGQWSPDGKTVVYQQGVDYVLYDVQTESRRNLLGPNASSFQRVYFSPTWAADSSRVYFKALRKDGTQEICSRSVIDEEPVRVHIKRPTYANIGLTFDGRIIVPYRSKVFGTVQLHAFDDSRETPQTDADGVHLAGQFSDRSSYGAAMSTDLKRLYYVSVPPSEEDVKAKAAVEPSAKPDPSAN